MQHTAPPTSVAPVREPSFAERVRTLLHVGRTGTLATHSRKCSGFPFASVMPYGLDDAGHPTFLVSAMAMHTQNLSDDSRASLLVTQPAWTEDPLAGARATLVGNVRRIDASESARDEYLARHPNARGWIGFGDFAFYRMEIVDVYWVAGFGAMGWVAAEQYASAGVDPLADVETGIVRHMNADHADALIAYCRHYAGLTPEAATLTSVDRLGFRMRIRTGDRVEGVRLEFPNEARTADDARKAFITMLRVARPQAD